MVIRRLGDNKAYRHMNNHCNSFEWEGERHKRGSSDGKKLTQHRGYCFARDEGVGGEFQVRKSQICRGSKWQ
jgi:hypothetical protein